MQTRVEQVGRVFCCTFDNGAVVRASRIRELPSGDYRGLLEVCDGDVLLHSSTVNMSVAGGRQAVVRSLNGSRDDWGSVIDAACGQVIHRLMRGSPTVEICSEDLVSPQRYLLDPFLPLDQPTMLFGKPGSTKSYLALLMTVMVALPDATSAFGWKTGSKSANSLYVDNETSRDTVHRRLQELVRGMGLPPISIHYKRLYGSLSSELEGIQQTILDEKIGFVVVDSAGKGCGGDIKEAGPVNEFYGALNQLGVTVLVVHHQPKDEFAKQKSPFGSQYFEANARSVWHAERGEGAENDFTVCLAHTKANDSGLHRPFGLRVRFDLAAKGKSVAFAPCDLKDSEFASKVPLRERMTDVLRAGALPTGEIAEQLGETEHTVRTTLNRWKNAFVKVDGKWALRAHD